MNNNSKNSVTSEESIRGLAEGISNLTVTNTPYNTVGYNAAKYYITGYDEDINSDEDEYLIRDIFEDDYTFFEKLDAKYLGEGRVNTDIPSVYILSLEELEEKGLVINGENKKIPEGWVEEMLPFLGKSFSTVNTVIEGSDLYLGSWTFYAGQYECINATIREVTVNDYTIKYPENDINLVIDNVGRQIGYGYYYEVHNDFYEIKIELFPGLCGSKVLRGLNIYTGYDKEELLKFLRVVINLITLNEDLGTLYYSHSNKDIIDVFQTVGFTEISNFRNPKSSNLVKLLEYRIVN